MEIHITEGKSYETFAPAHIGRMVRVFVNQDYHYGVFVDENILCNLLSEDEKIEYLKHKDFVKFDVSDDVAQVILDKGFSPYKSKRS